MLRLLMPLLLAAAAAPAFAADHSAHSGHQMAQSAAADVALTDGTVKKVNKAAGKITLAHGPIENIGMGAMTMMFKVKDPAMLDGVKPGDKVRFRVDYAGSEFVVTHIEAAK
jgi:Cu/Ag efflux protein CusF